MHGPCAPSEKLIQLPPTLVDARQGVSVSGRVVQGRVRSGDKVVVMPLEDPATAARLERNGAPAKAARAGDNAEVGRWRVE